MKMLVKIFFSICVIAILLYCYDKVSRFFYDKKDDKNAIIQIKVINKYVDDNFNSYRPIYQELVDTVESRLDARSVTYGMKERYKWTIDTLLVFNRDRTKFTANYIGCNNYSTTGLSGFLVIPLCGIRENNKWYFMEGASYIWLPYDIQREICKQTPFSVTVAHTRMRTYCNSFSIIDNQLIKNEDYFDRLLTKEDTQFIPPKRPDETMAEYYYRGHVKYKKRIPSKNLDSFFEKMKKPRPDCVEPTMNSGRMKGIERYEKIFSAAGMTIEL